MKLAIQSIFKAHMSLSAAGDRLCQVVSRHTLSRSPPARPPLFPVWMGNIYDQHRSYLDDDYGVHPRSAEDVRGDSDLKGPNRTFDEIIANLVERAKQQRLEDELEAILARNRFVAL